MKRSYILPLAAVAILASVLFLPISIPLSIVVPGKVMASREWVLTRGQEGSIAAVLRDQTDGSVQNYSLNRFERGDVVRLNLHPDIRPHARVEVGDTIATVFSNETQRQLTQLTGELSTILASLDLDASGEKASIVEEARTRLSSAEERAWQNNQVLTRLRSLRARSLISEQDLEFSESQQRVLEADIAEARAGLDVVLTGAKSQQLDLTRAEAAALRDEIAMLNERLNLFTITTPIGGMVVRSFGSDTLLTVLDTSDYVIVMPVPLAQHYDLAREQGVDVEVLGTSIRVKGHIMQLGDAVHVINEQQVMLVIAGIDNTTDMLPGATTRCTIDNGELHLREYLIHMSKMIFQ